ncbi:MAG TPA: signal peptidase I [Pyrinomonadaceae bacterium]|jgi:signal peptidase I|nr:signal peptidase I [Pyrinomonadaceae bacterium]
MASTAESKETETETLPADAAPEGEEHGPPRSLWREYFESGVVTLIMALFFMTFVAQAAEVPSASMQNTIYVGDHFLINKFIFAPGPPLPFLPQREIRRGDIIVFKYPSDVDTDETVIRYQTLYIKRVIGLPGETIEVRGADVLVNGRVLPEHRLTADVRQQSNVKAPLDIIADPPRRQDEQSYSVYYDPETLKLRESKSSFFQYGVNNRPTVVPEGHYFVMGDNRDNSSDSRRWGFVPRELIVGRAMFVLWSYDESAPSSGNPIVNLFKNTRWARTGTLLR